MTMNADKASSWDAVKQAHILDGDTSRLKNYYQHWADRYDHDVRNEQYSGPAYIADLLKHLPSNDDMAVNPEDPDIEILDAGCGTGLVGKELARRDYQHIDGFDLIPILFQRVIKRLILFSRKGGRYDGLPQIISRRNGIAGPSAHRREQRSECVETSAGGLLPCGF